MAIINDFIGGQFASDSTETVGIGGFKTSSVVRERISRSREIPTAYLEDGSHSNDHIIRNPLLVLIEGVVSDVFVLPNEPLLQSSIDDSLGLISQYAPTRTQSEISRINGINDSIQGAINFANDVISGGQIFSGVGSSTSKSNIELFIDTMEGIVASDALIKIDAPLRTYENMAIVSLDYDRDSETNSLNFTIEAQQFRFVETAFSEVAIAPSPSTATGGQTAGVSDKGPQEGKKATEKEKEESLFSSILR